jgi:hypothetical protein
MRALLEKLVLRKTQFWTRIQGLNTHKKSPNGYIFLSVANMSDFTESNKNATIWSRN